MTDATKWWTFWLFVVIIYSSILSKQFYDAGYAKGANIDNARKAVLDDLGKSLEYQIQLKQMLETTP